MTRFLRRFSSGASVLFFVAAGGLAIILGWESNWAKTWRKPILTAEVKTLGIQGSPLLRDFALVSGVEALTQTVEKPLFIPTRRPPPPPPPPTPPKPVMVKGLYQLTGTLTVGERRFGYFREIKSGKTLRVEQGGSVSGMKLSLVEPNRVTLTQYDDQELLELKVARSTVLSPAPGSGGSTPINPQGQGGVPIASQPPGTAINQNSGVQPGQPSNASNNPPTAVSGQPATPFGPR